MGDQNAKISYAQGPNITILLVSGTTENLYLQEPKIRTKIVRVLFGTKIARELFGNKIPKISYTQGTKIVIYLFFLLTSKNQVDTYDVTWLFLLIIYSWCKFPGDDLYDSAIKFRMHDFPAFALEVLPNRNSLTYGDLYGIQNEASTIFRGTLRYEGSF